MIKAGTWLAQRPVTDLERPGLFDRILAKAIDDGVCLIWTGATSRGCPVMRHRGRLCSVRRLVFEATTGRNVPEGLVPASQCRRSACVSPDCLMVRTVSELRRIDAQRGVYSHPESNLKRRRASLSIAKFSEELVQQARTFEGTCAQAAAATGISLSHVKKIRLGQARVPMTNVWRGLQ